MYSHCPVILHLGTEQWPDINVCLKGYLTKSGHHQVWTLSQDTGTENW